MIKLSWSEQSPSYVGKFWALTRSGEVEFVEVRHRCDQEGTKYTTSDVTNQRYVYDFGSQVTFVPSRWSHWLPVTPPEVPTTLPYTGECCDTFAGCCSVPGCDCPSSTDCRAVRKQPTYNKPDSDQAIDWKDLLTLYTDAKRKNKDCPQGEKVCDRPNQAEQGDTEEGSLGIDVTITVCDENVYADLSKLTDAVIDELTRRLSVIETK